MSCSDKPGPKVSCKDIPPLELFPVSRKPEKLSAHKGFISEWEKMFPEIPLRFPRDAKVMKSLVQQTSDMLLRMQVEDTDEKRIEFFSIVLKNLPHWFVGKTLPVLDSHYPSVIDQILKQNVKGQNNSSGSPGNGKATTSRFRN